MDSRISDKTCPELMYEVVFPYCKNHAAVADTCVVRCSICYVIDLFLIESPYRRGNRLEEVRGFSETTVPYEFQICKEPS